MCAKYYLLISLFCVSFSNLFSQNVSINNTGTAANTHAMLDVDDATNTKGILIPRITQTQRTAISLTSADIGLMVFQNDQDTGFWYWDGADWERLMSSENCFGEMADSASVNDTIKLTSVGVFFKINSFQEGTLHNVTYLSGTLTIQKAGYYLINYAIGGYSDNNKENFEFAILKNSVACMTSEVEQRMDTKASKESTCSSQCIVYLSIGDIIELGVKTDNNTNDFVATHGSVTVVKIN